MLFVLDLESSKEVKYFFGKLITCEFSPILLNQNLQVSL